MHNIAYIDGQNLHLGIQSAGWKLDFARFRKYLAEKYHVIEAYYFMGFLSDDEQLLYSNLQKAGYIVMFREHHATMKGKKKGNVDVDIVFTIMHRLYKNKDFDKIVLVSGDGDYIKLVKFLIQEQCLYKILFPNNNYSSLYHKIDATYRDNLSIPDIQKKIGYQST